MRQATSFRKRPRHTARRAAQPKPPVRSLPGDRQRHRLRRVCPSDPDTRRSATTAALPKTTPGRRACYRHSRAMAARLMRARLAYCRRRYRAPVQAGARGRRAWALCRSIVRETIFTSCHPKKRKALTCTAAALKLFRSTRRAAQAATRDRGMRVRRLPPILSSSFAILTLFHFSALRFLFYSRLNKIRTSHPYTYKYLIHVCIFTSFQQILCLIILRLKWLYSFPSHIRACTNTYTHPFHF